MSKKRAVAYPRYSSDNQREESIHAQMRAIEEYCKQKGYILVGSYPDEARSATTDNRPNFQRMVKDSAKGLFDVVIVHKLDRFARDRYDSAFYKRELKKNGVRLESVLEQFDNTPESIILESVLEGMAEYYSKNLAREARKGMLENASKGLHAGGRPPYGYKVNSDMRYEIDEEKARAVQIYFERIAKGWSLQKIADMLNEMGLRTQTGRKFTPNSFDGWAANQKYKGVFTWDVREAKGDDGKRNDHLKKSIDQQTIIPGAIPAIVSEELWNRVNSLMATRKRQSGSMRAKVNYLLSGKIICGKCGSVYAGDSYRNAKSKDNTILSYYKCNARCGNKSLKKEAIEQLVIDELLEVCFSEQTMHELADKVQNLYIEQYGNAEDAIQPIKKELAEIDKKIRNWIDLAGEGLFDKTMLADQVKETNRRKEILEAELIRLEALQQSKGVNRDMIFELLNTQKHLLQSSNDEDKKQVLQDYVESITVFPSDDPKNFDIEIEYRGISGGGELTPLLPLQKTIVPYIKL